MHKNVCGLDPRTIYESSQGLSPMLLMRWGRWAASMFGLISSVKEYYSYRWQMYSLPWWHHRRLLNLRLCNFCICSLVERRLGPLWCVIDRHSLRVSARSSSTVMACVYNASNLYRILHFMYSTALTTRSTGTVHASAKARLTSVAIRLLIRIRIRDPDRHQNLIICSLAHCQPPLKISCKSVWKFLRKVADRQTDRQTDKQTTTITYPP